MKKMKLLVITPYFYPKIGGLENYAFNISKGLMKDYNYEMVVITSNHESKEYKEEKLGGIKIYRLPYQFKISNTPISFRWKIQIKKIIEKENPNVINAHTPVPFISDIACRVAHKLKIHFVLTYHNDLVKDNFFVNLICKTYYLILGNKTLKLSNKIIATSQYYAENSPYLFNHLDKIEIVSPGVNIPKEKINQKTKKEKIVLFVGQLDKTHHHKGLNYLIEAIQKVKKNIEDVKLVVIGSGDNLEEYKQQVKLFNLKNNVKFLGRASDSELSKNYNIANAIILPSYNSSEGFGMILIEGMAHKKPVIGTTVGGIPYVIKNNVDGLLVPPKDPETLSKTIIKILNNPTSAKQMGENGYKKVKENFTWNKKAKETNKILKEFAK